MFFAAIVFACCDVIVSLQNFSLIKSKKLLHIVKNIIILQVSLAVAIQTVLESVLLIFDVFFVLDSFLFEYPLVFFFFCFDFLVGVFPYDWLLYLINNKRKKKQSYNYGEYDANRTNEMKKNKIHMKYHLQTMRNYNFNSMLSVVRKRDRRRANLINLIRV